MNRFISKVELLLKTGFFHIFGSSVINKIISFLSSIILVRILTKEEYGAFTYAWNIYSIILLLSGFGIESGVLQVASEKSGEREYTKKIYSFGTRLGIKFNILLGVILIGMALFVPLKIGNAKELLIMLCALPIVQLLYGLATGYLRSQKQNKEFSVLSTINTFFVFIISVICSVFFREKGMIAGYYISFIISILVAFVKFDVNLFASKRKVSQSEKRAVLSIAFVSMCNNGLSQLLYLLDVFVLGIVDPTETVLASYKVSTMIPSALTFIPLALVTYLYPYFAEHKDDGRWCLNKYKEVVIGLGTFNACISLVLYVFAPLIVTCLFGNQYMDAVPVFRILAINYFISGTFRALSGNLLVTQRKLKFNLVVAILSGVINLFADYFFIKWWGPMGAAFATVLVVLVSSTLSTTYLVYTFKKKS